ncbi:hypothetical protein FB45DRAFT_904216 [Roridomyces roridus]|uniref:RRN7-type domain-containing protein n=1 Tax=Roridomyces roridus TaxID=1738132 RepID=A0AAD7C4W7_9AGAR|nr:hypothetical protein FB45DRAFT_904216 [Roridomyces roridus]
MAPRCPVCRSRQWHKEPSSGLVACSEGHILQNYRQETNEVDGFGPHALKKRALKSTRQHRSRAENDPQLYHGNRARYFYFQCLQLLLRHQIAFLTDRWSLPVEFEVVCRDLWALHLSLLRDPPPHEPYVSAKDPETGDADEAKEAQEDEDENGTEPETDFDDLLAENSASSSSSEEEDGEGRKPLPQPKRPGRYKRYDDRPISTLVVLVLACWILRIPILYCDLTRLIESFELPYLDATRFLPENMTVHLTQHNTQALSPLNTPSVQSLHRMTTSLARRIHSSYGVRTPEVNAAPMLWRVIMQGLGGNPTLYRLTKRLAAVLSLPLTLHHSLAARLQRRRTRDPETHKKDNVAPEVAFLATGIIVLKMVYGLDGESRFPIDSDDAACEMPRLEAYLERLGRLPDGRFEFDSSAAMPIEDLSDDTVDKYLAFCERALLPSSKNEEDVVNRWFPVPERPKSGDGADGAYGQLPAWDLAATALEGVAEDALGPGEQYKVLQASTELSGEYSKIVEHGSKWAGVEAEYLCEVVLSYELRLKRPK